MSPCTEVLACAMADDQWFWLDSAGEQRGPVSSAEMRSMALAAGTFVTNAEGTRTGAIETLPELAAKPQASPQATLKLGTGND